MIVPVSVDRLPALVEEATLTSRRFKIKSIDAENADLTVGISWRTFGGKIHLQFKSALEESSFIEALWSPIVGTTVIDYGQGAKDIRELHQIISNQTGR